MTGNKIIICKGNDRMPARFWAWAVCKKEEFTESMKEGGWVESGSSKYLNSNQFNYLDKAN
ncbi:hypothetical protein [Psychrobacillus sp. FSL H8-0510]|uniref:hypothetical protein n=1 Tax=Psychrobacillus sp. FSL H8-0510 TaxID=2921394 RepID=UPI0030F6DA44